MKILRKRTTTRQVGKCELFAGEKNKNIFHFLNHFFVAKVFFLNFHFAMFSEIEAIFEH